MTARKKLTPSKIQKKKPTKKKSVVLASVTKKLEDAALSRTLKRRQAARDMGEHDIAVPEMLRTYGSSDHSGPVRVRLNAQPLSPFVLNLKQELPSPEEILEDRTRIRLNLLDGSLLRENPLRPVEKNALVLNHSDVLPQLIEETRRGKAERFILHSTPRHTQAISFASFHSFPDLTRISIESFFPKQTPEDIFAYFDLPQEDHSEEEEEESELVELTQETFTPAPTRPSVFAFFQNATLLRPIGAFVLISFIFVLPLHAMNLVSTLRQAKTDVQSASEEAFAYLKTGASKTAGQQATDAGQAFSLASDRFAKAQQGIQDLGATTSLLLSVIPAAQKNLSTGKALLKAGEHLSIAGGRVAEAMDALAHEPSPTPVSRIRILQSYLRTITPHLTQAVEAIDTVDPSVIPTDQQETFMELKNRLIPLSKTLANFDELSDLAITILGGDQTKRYLLIFQNNAEMRATGGFMGSYAEIKVSNGQIEELNVPGGGTYDLQGQLRHLRAAPEPLQLLKANWEFQDANWFPDFPTSARQMIEFYTDAGGPSVDGVIAINATAVADLIGLLGPVEMSDYGRTIDQENFLFEAQKIVELEYDRTENKPKQFIGDLATKLIERTEQGDPEIFLGAIDQFSKGLQQKDIQIYFSNDTLQRAALERGWSGAIASTSGDYVMVVDTNLGGGKTDAVIEEHVDVQVQIATDGTVIDTVTLKRTHHGIPGLVFTGVNNVDYLRVYVPKGSELISSSGFSIPDGSLFETPESDWMMDADLQFAQATKSRDEKTGTDIYEEQGKTVFGNWIQTPPGATTTATFIYRLPFKIFDADGRLRERLRSLMRVGQAKPYSLLVQKQSGILDRTTTVSVSLPETLKNIWSSTGDTRATLQNTTDEFFAMLIEPPL
ncbi:DUF4012 domain-containing protein [Candidatus Uhrbacteria bacterium]|nr:DUF4012 domain-containing protein [Candidatus Uhrbacteria bacterium]